MDNGSVKKGTRLCYKKNEGGYCWVFVTDHSNGRISYVREGKSVTVPDTVLGTRLFETLQEAREKGLLLDDAFEAQQITAEEDRLKTP